MERQAILTADGSHTISLPQWQVTYHSVHGALQESLHVFIEAGLKPQLYRPQVRVLEMGFGTGLNALLTLREAGEALVPVLYEGVEAYPLAASEVATLNYVPQLGDESLTLPFARMHQSGSGTARWLTPHFRFTRHLTTLQAFSTAHRYDLVYYDAFAPQAQPELWTPEIFARVAGWMAPGALLVTYCCKGDVRRALESVGLVTEKLPGPPGKREMLRARKPEAAD